MEFRRLPRSQVGFAIFLFTMSRHISTLIVVLFLQLRRQAIDITRSYWPIVFSHGANGIFAGVQGFPNGIIGTFSWCRIYRWPDCCTFGIFKLVHVTYSYIFHKNGRYFWKCESKILKPEGFFRETLVYRFYVFHPTTYFKITAAGLMTSTHLVALTLKQFCYIYTGFNELLPTGTLAANFY